MDFSDRILTISKAVKYRSFADIGTDHGYVPISLIKSGIGDYGIACDINKGPLKIAKENIGNSMLSHKIETRLGNGIEPVETGEVETIIISGMGGLLIKDILDKDVEKTKSFKQLLLSPHSHVSKVREYLHSIGFKIDTEKMFVDEGKYYTLISALKGEEKYKSEVDYLFGKINIDEKSPVLKEYLEKGLSKLTQINALLIATGSENSLIKARENEKEIDLYKEGLNRYEL